MKELLKQIRYLIAEILIGIGYQIMPDGNEKTGLKVWQRTNVLYDAKDD